jgi:hypothetical protein
MSYNGSGTFQINTSGQPVVTGTVISSTAFNSLTSDLATGLSTAITKDGQTATTARIPFVFGYVFKHLPCDNDLKNKRKKIFPFILR